MRYIPSVIFAGTAIVLSATVHPASAKLLNTCGPIQSLAAAYDVSAQKHPLGFSLVSASGEYVHLGVRRSDPDRDGLMTVVSTAYLANKNLYVVHDGRFAKCIQIQPGLCPFPMPEPRCIEDNVTRKRKR